MKLMDDFKRIITEKPILVFYGMVFFIIVGIGYMVIEYLTYEPPKKEIIINSDGGGFDNISRGVGNILSVTSAMKKVKDLETEVNLIMMKDKLNKADSTRVVEIYDEIENIVEYIKTQK